MRENPVMLMVLLVLVIGAFLVLPVAAAVALINHGEVWLGVLQLVVTTVIGTLGLVAATAD